MPYRRQKGMIIMIKQAISAFAAAVAVSFASAAFAENANVVEKLPVTNFTLTDTGKEGAAIDSDTQKITLTYFSEGQKKGNSWTNLDDGKYDAESYLKYTAPADGKVTFAFKADKTNYTDKGKNNRPRIYWTYDNDGKPYAKALIPSDCGGYFAPEGANLEADFSLDVKENTVYYIYGYSWFGNNTRTTYTLTDFKFTSTADITAATEYKTTEYSGTDKGFTANLTGSDAGTINWYAKSSGAAAYSKIGSVSTGITGEDSTTFTAGLVISEIDGNDFNYEIGASIN